MDISGISDSGLVSLAQNMSAKRLHDNVGIAVQKMANDQLKIDGNNMIQLINGAAPAPVGPLGNNIDVKV